LCIEELQSELEVAGERRGAIEAQRDLLQGEKTSLEMENMKLNEEANKASANEEDKHTVEHRHMEEGYSMDAVPRVASKEENSEEDVTYNADDLRALLSGFKSTANKEAKSPKLLHKSIGRPPTPRGVEEEASLGLPSLTVSAMTVPGPRRDLTPSRRDLTPSRRDLTPSRRVEGTPLRRSDVVNDVSVVDTPSRKKANYMSATSSSKNREAELEAQKGKVEEVQAANTRKKWALKPEANPELYAEEDEEKEALQKKIQELEAKLDNSTFTESAADSKETRLSPRTQVDMPPTGLLRCARKHATPHYTQARKISPERRRASRNKDSAGKTTPREGASLGAQAGKENLGGDEASLHEVTLQPKSRTAMAPVTQGAGAWSRMPGQSGSPLKEMVKKIQEKEDREVATELLANARHQRVKRTTSAQARERKETTEKKIKEAAHVKPQSPIIKKRSSSPVKLVKGSLGKMLCRKESPTRRSKAGYSATSVPAHELLEWKGGPSTKGFSPAVA